MKSEKTELKDTLMTLEELCEILNVRKSYIYKLTSQNRIPYYKIGGLRFKMSEIEKWIEKSKVEKMAAKTFDQLID